MNGPSNSRGQILPLAVFLLLGFAVAVAFVMNTGETVFRKIQAQNATDAAAMTQATWMARSMNLIAMNNTAIVQTYAITTTYAAATDTVQKSTYNMIEEAIHYVDLCGETYGLSCVLQMAAPLYWYEEIFKPNRDIWCALGVMYWCQLQRIGESGGVFGWVKDILKVVREVANLRGSVGESLYPLRVREFGELTQAFSAMNDAIVEEFPSISAEIAAEIARTNSLTVPPRFMHDFSLPPQSLRSPTPVSLSTPLPLRRQSLMASSDSNDLQSGAETIFGGDLKVGGETGSDKLLLRNRKQNFLNHGYKSGAGPYAVAKKTVEKVVMAPVEAQQETAGTVHNPLCDYFPVYDFFGWEFDSCPLPRRLPYVRQFRDVKGVDPAYSQVVDNCWQYGTRTSLIPAPPIPIYGGGYCLPRLLESPLTTGIYVLDGSVFGYSSSSLGVPILDEGMNVLALVEMPFEAGTAAASRFGNPTRALFGVAQARVENTAYPDMFTQEWRAYLVPVSMLTADEFSAASTALVGLEPSRELYRSISRADMESLSR